MRINPDDPTPKTGGGTSRAGQPQPEPGTTGKRSVPAHMETLLRLADEASGGSASDVAFKPAENGIEIKTGSALKAYRVALQTDGLKITPRDFAYELRERHLPPLVQLGDNVKRGLPGFVAKSRAQRFQELTEVVRAQADQVREDNDKRMRLSEWFSSLDADARAKLTAIPASEGMASWMQPLVVRVGNDSERIFNAGYLMNLPREVVAALPRDKQLWIEDRRETWGSLGITNGTQAQAFLQNHFEITQIDVDGTLPPELARLCELEPALHGKLRSLQERGLTMQFVKAVLTPDEVLDAVRHLARSQRAFVSHWLPDLIANGNAPTLTAADFEAIAKGHIRAYRKATKRVETGSLEAQLTEAQLADSLASQFDFVSSAELIRGFSNGVMGIVLTGGGPEQHEELERINHVLHEYFGSEWAKRRVGLDDSERVGEGVRETLMTLLWLSPLAEVVQRVMHLDGFAKFMAGSFDNLAAERGELKTWSAAGVPTEDLVKRAGFLSLVVGADVDLSFHIDDIARTLGPHVAGGAFSLSAVLLPLFTTLFAIQYFAGQYRKLDREGKLPNGMKLSDDERTALDELASKDGLISRVSAALDKQKAEPAVRDAIVAAMQKMESPQIEENPEANRQGTGLAQATAKGAKEVMVVNQSQLGLLIASVGSIVVGAILGDAILHDATLEAITGAAELPLAALSLQGMKVLNSRGWNHYVKKREPLGLLGPGPAGTGSGIATT